jgi:hypothetical protein
MRTLRIAMLADSLFHAKNSLSFLADQYGGNLKEKGVVKVSATDTLWSHCPPIVVVDLKSSCKAFATTHVINSWIQIDFLNYRTNPTLYSIHTRTEFDHDQLRSWVIKGSNDSGKNWTELNQRSQNYDLNGVDRVRRFPIANWSEIWSIRIRQTGVISNENNDLVLKCIEFFDTLLPSGQ